jgi:tripartite-type tricarboxylate transporter receptor subunit TctC
LIALISAQDIDQQRKNMNRTNITIAMMRTLGTMALLVCGTITSGLVSAQTYPARPIRVIVTFPPGSVNDIIARIIGSKLTAQLGQQVVVDTRPGGSGAIGVEIAKAAPPDGYTLLMANYATFALLPALKRNLSYDPDKDFIAITRVGSGAYVLGVHPSLGVATVADLIKLAKARPGQLNFGSSGNGSIQHLAGEMLNVLADVKTVHVPYKGAVLALNDLIAGQIQFVVAGPSIVMPHAKTARLKVIATTGAKRDPLHAELPTMIETLPGFEITSWQGMVLPAKTPAVIVNRLHTEIVKALQSPDVREQLAKQGSSAETDSPAEFKSSIKSERERAARIGRQTNITLD